MDMVLIPGKLYTNKNMHTILLYSFKLKLMVYDSLGKGEIVMYTGKVKTSGFYKGKCINKLEYHEFLFEGKLMYISFISNLKEVQ